MSEWLVELPWYDLVELRRHTDAWWHGIAGHLRAAGVAGVPARLVRGGDHVERWRAAKLLLSQACGYDVLYDQREHITPVATPCYLAEGCEGARYRSYVVVRADRPWRTFADLRGLRVAINQASSHSGNNAMRPEAASLHRNGAFFGEVVETGSHLESLRRVHALEIEAACIDAVVLALLRRVRPAAVAGLRAVACTRTALSPPYVTSVHTPPDVRRALQKALALAIADPALQPAREALLLRDFAFFPPDAYAELEDFEAPALAAGYRELPAPARSPLNGPPD